MTFKMAFILSLLYMNDLFKPAGQNTSATRASLFKLSQLLQKTNHGQKILHMWHVVSDTSIAIFLRNNREHQHA